MTTDLSPGPLLVGLLAVGTLVGTTSIARAFDRLEQWLEGSEERLVIFPTYGATHEDGSVTVPVHAWVYEPEEDSTSRQLLINTLKSALDIDDPTEEQYFERRIRPFLVDNERGKRIRMKVGGETYKVGTTTPDGHTKARIRLPQKVVEEGAHRSDGRRWLEPTFDAEFGSIEQAIPIVDRTGVSVISDIDDTIKITEVLDRREMLRNTFFREFRAVPGMSSVYGEIDRAHRPVFHYLSASPWQLLSFLRNFMRRTGFPLGLFHLRSLRVKSISSPLDFINGSSDYKLATIGRILSDFPEREFILIGDSSEHDPEIYGKIAADHPEQVRRIWIRRVDGANNEPERLEKAFEDVPDDRWTAFDDPSAIAADLPDGETSGEGDD